MSVIARYGRFGSYYGSIFSESGMPSESQMKQNAVYIASYLQSQGWTLNAISALLGNMQAESALNSGRWQSDNVGNTSGGYGLVQWTPASKYTEWCDSKGYTDPSEMDNNLARIIHEVDNNIQWIATSAYNYSFKTFSTSNKTVSELAKAFLLNYERPADQSESVQSYRAGLGETWYTYLTETEFEPTNPSEPINRKQRKFNFILFNKRRKQQWTRKNF